MQCWLSIRSFHWLFVLIAHASALGVSHSIEHERDFFFPFLWHFTCHSRTQTDGLWGKISVTSNWLPIAPAVWKSSVSWVLHVQLKCRRLSFSSQPRLEMHTLIVLCCHLDGQVSRISAKAVSQALIFDQSRYGGYHEACKADRHALSIGSFSNLIAQTSPLLICPEGWGHNSPYFDFLNKGQNSGETAFNLWEMDKMDRFVFAQKIRGVTLLWPAGRGCSDMFGWYWKTYFYPSFVTAIKTSKQKALLCLTFVLKLLHLMRGRIKLLPLCVYDCLSL